MPLTDSQFKTLILEEIGQVGNETLANRVELLWTMYEEQSYIHPNLRYLYTLTHAIRWLMGQNWEKHQWADGASLRFEQQKIQNLLLLLKENKELLKEAEENPAVGMLPVSADIEAKCIRFNVYSTRQIEAVECPT